MNKRPKKLKRVPLKEELAALTGCFIKALILQQFLYWSERVFDFDDFIIEEKERTPSLELEFRHGWIYKSTEQLHDELMFGDSLSPRTVKRRLDEIVESGYLVSRNNPEHKWDRCLQYRPDIIKIQIDLQEIGYALEGYPLFVLSSPFDTMSNGSDTVSNQTDIETNRTVANVEAIPETTPETTPDILENSQNPKPQYTNIERQTLNRLGKTIAHSGNIGHVQTTDELRTITLIGADIAQITKTDILTVDLGELRALASLTIRLSNNKGDIAAKLKLFKLWWYNEYWLGKDKSQPPTIKQFGSTWGQFEASQTIQTNGATNAGPVLTETEKKRLAELIAENGCQE